MRIDRDAHLTVLNSSVNIPKFQLRNGPTSIQICRGGPVLNRLVQLAKRRLESPLSYQIPRCSRQRLLQRLEFCWTPFPPGATQAHSFR
eukprot:CAMPEP_0179413570 /NCGR_PEP_ID=MMETSP0799-20121207/5172_1 /TAXON_ID=46947 /ORGANISM="Geminigera cryophila, Strain CCMP2564" /LENGTH=88 /DNA_ID=CAMNT_0021186057 /DNA_START=178 /DNA_END=441 /DNA_ORIENTATION=-